MRLIKLAERIAVVLFYVFLVWLLYQIILKLTGHSPTIETILSTAMVTIISYILVTTLKIAEFMGETKEFMSTAKNSFGMIKNDMASLKNDMTVMKEEIRKIRKK